MPPYRVQKRTIEQSLKKRKGRPPKYSDLWKKKLLVLRLCGLKNKHTVRIFREEAGATCTESFLRTAQEVVKKLLSEPPARYISPDKRLGRKRAAFLRNVLARHIDSAPVKSGPPPSVIFDQAIGLAVSSTVPSQPTIAHVSENELPCRLSGQSSSFTSLEPLETNDEPAQSPTYASHLALPLGGAFASQEHFTADNRDSAISTKSASIRYSTASVYTSNSSFTEKRTSSIFPLTRNPKWRRILSFSSSLSGKTEWSDLIQNISRLSLSDRSMFSRRSDIVPFEIQAAEGSCEVRINKVISERRKQHDEAKLQLTQTCCNSSVTISNPLGCIHLRVRQLSTSTSWVDSELSTFEERLPYAAIKEQTPLSIHGENHLFFAAREGIHVAVVMALIDITENVNAVNTDGQNFLYFMQPKVLCSQCTCTWCPPHTVAFECLVRTLEKRNFNFEHVDNHGQSIFSFLFAWDPSRWPTTLAYIDSASDWSKVLKWLRDLMLRDNRWNDRICRMAQNRDVNGLFLGHFMATQPAGVDFCPKDFVDQFGLGSPEIISQIYYSEDNESGKSDLHVYIQGSFLHIDTPPPFPFKETITKINRYSFHGQTPTMDFLMEADRTNMPENVICVKIQRLLHMGANINACSRIGTTILHFAAMKSKYHLAELLLTTPGVERKQRDKYSLTAFEHAIDVFQSSWSEKKTTENTANAGKTLMAFFSHTPKNEFPEDGQLAMGTVYKRMKKIMEKTGQKKVPEPSSLASSA